LKRVSGEEFEFYIPKRITKMVEKLFFVILLKKILDLLQERRPGYQTGQIYWRFRSMLEQKLLVV